MNNPWKIQKLAFAPLQIIDGDRGKNYPKQDEFLDSGYCLFLNAGNVTLGGFDFSKCQFITENKDNILRKGKLSRNDVVMTTRGTVGNIGFFNDQTPYENIRINSGMVIFRCNTEQLIPSYLYQFLRSPLFKGQVNALRSGVAQPQLPIKDMKYIDIIIPPFDTQHRIVDVLSTYDILIENNCRRIKLLERSAHLLYKEWFLHLRFPSHEHVKIVDGIPEGWERKPLNIICNDVRDSVTPIQVEPNTPYIGLEHIPRKSITLADWGCAEDVTSNKFKFVEGDILFGKIRPYFHKVGFALTNGITSSDTIVIRPETKDLYSYCLLLLSSEEFVSLASKTVREGSKMPRADWEHLTTRIFLKPPKVLLEQFNEVVIPILNQLKNLAQQNRQLSMARDLLLPRVVNGEIAV